MPKFWCANPLTRKVFQYTQSEGITDFPRGEFLAYGDYIITGIESREEAQKWVDEYACCHKCRNSWKGHKGDPCPICKEPMTHHEEGAR